MTLKLERRAHSRVYWPALAAVLLLGAGYLHAIWRSGQPVALADVPDGKAACMSYTPRQSIPGPDSRVTAAQIEADLALLTPATHCVRTYSARGGLEAVPAIARKHGLRMLLGIWIGTDKKTNEAEIAAGLSAARDYPDVIDGIIVGNEVLLRHEQTVDSLYAYVARVNAATDVPVTYADVWEFWHTGAKLAGAVDYVTIHILPYWENEPVGVNQALAHVRDIYAEMQAKFPGMRLVIGETGWPTRGRQREGARPSLVNGAHFVRDFIAWANAQALPYNLIEAFDQPWKRGNEGTVGGYWGLYDTGGHLKYPLKGPVVEDPLWQAGFALAAALALLAPITGRFIAGRFAAGGRAHLWLAATGMTAGALLYAQWRYVPSANRDAIEMTETVAALVCGWLLVIGLAGWLCRSLTGSPGTKGPCPGLMSGVDALRASGVPRTARLLSLLRLALLFGIAYVCLGLALDPRYRDFPLAITALPALLLTLRQIVARDLDRIGSEERMLAAIIVVCAIASAAIEGPRNAPALCWIGSCLLLAGSTLRLARTETGQHQRGEQDAGAGRVETV